MNTLKTLRLESKYEFLKLLRLRSYAISTIAFPVMFYAFFGLTMGRRSLGDSMPMARYLLGTYGAFGVIGACLFGVGAGLAVERGLGWLRLKRASPMPVLSYFVAKLFGSICFGAAVVGILFALGAIFGGVTMRADQWIVLAGALVAGSIPFCALGLAIGYFTSPNSAPGVVNMINLPMAFCSGLWIPIGYLPQFVQTLAPALPGYHFAQIALGILGAPTRGSVGGHLGALLGFTILFAGIAWMGHRREQAGVYR
jgi:ABC-2 type transport system permease protein